MMLGFSVKPEIASLIKQEADKGGYSLSAFIRKVMADYFTKNNSKKAGTKA